MSNRLAKENSLYLRQHGENPVHWYPWGEAAFAAAREQDKPLLISIGYSACHWCHVMAHECFEDDYIAGLMNKHFICVKVDREERPDVDQIYMEAVQMIQHHGGWPLNVFCLPDGRPFFGGTYFPPEDRGKGLIPWPQVLMRVSEHYQRSHGELLENAEAIQKNIIAGSQSGAAGAQPDRWDPARLTAAARGICGNHDDRYGGFGGAPKFPPSMTLNFLSSLRRSAAVEEQDPELAARIDTVTHQTLRAMAHGGLFDQFGGGFARYSVDAHWLIPHFEKMLYDNALLIEAYARAWLDRPEPLYRAVVEETIGWVEREMSAPEGGFHAALDADSEGEEGRYYVWTPEEVISVLGEAEGKRLCAAYHITPEGNFEHGRSNPALVEDDFAARKQLASARRQLREHREQTRTAPGKDTKINTAWNCLMIRALATAGFTFGRPDWLTRARRAVDFIRDRIVHDSGGEARLHAVYYEGSGPQIDGYLHDYALASEAFLAVASKLEWIEPGGSAPYFKQARAFAETALRHFADPRGPGFFFTADDVATPVTRRKEWYDNATPAGNSSLLHALGGLYTVTGEARYAAELAKLLPAYSGAAERIASAVSHALEAATDQAVGIAVIKFAPGVSLDALQVALTKRPWRRCFILPADDSLPEGHYQLCIGTQCLAPTTDPEALAVML